VTRIDPELFRQLGERFFPGHVGLDVIELEHGRALGVLEIQERHMAPNGYLHAGAVVSLADTVCGYGCVASLPEGRSGFTTIELKTNFIGSAREGTLRCEGRLVHGGRTTQVWDATVTDSAGKPIALFRCTQLLLCAPS
jgi:1,4-dihydroxy-2-naphthoyl-CoA hydrolase